MACCLAMLIKHQLDHKEHISMFFLFENQKFSYVKMHLKCLQNVSASMCYLIEAEWHIYSSVHKPSLVQIMACRLDGAKPLSEPVLEYFNWTLGSKLQWNRNQNWYIFNQENAFENVVRNLAAILSRPQCVKSIDIYIMLSANKVQSNNPPHPE